jgi:hypothetical protein
MSFLPVLDERMSNTLEIDAHIFSENLAEGVPYRNIFGWFCAMQLVYLLNWFL